MQSRNGKWRGNCSGSIVWIGKLHQRRDTRSVFEYRLAHRPLGPRRRYRARAGTHGAVEETLQGRPTNPPRLYWEGEMVLQTGLLAKIKKIE